jgi:50S ribosomal protein L16 3-hydroxylase
MPPNTRGGRDRGRASAAPLGNLSVDEFLRTRWQRRPLLIRQAIPGFEAPLDAAALIALAGDDAVESRLVSRARGRWKLASGPFQPEDIPPLSRRNWSLLVQGVDLHHDAAHALLSRFRFVPDARLDDLMISLASDGGGVGPHVDSYDVFLLQAWGRRRWRVGPVRSQHLVDGLPLRILADFEPDEEWLLEPGDMLYLPPGWGHDGIAEGPCMTCSIGFRAPSRHEFLAAFLAEAADSPGGPDLRFGDRGRSPARLPARIPDDLYATLSAWADDWRPGAARIETFVGRFLTEPKPSVWFDAHPIGFETFVRRCREHGLRLDRRTRILWRADLVHINGESVHPPAAARAQLRRLADRRSMHPADFHRIPDEDELLTLLHEWATAGWLRAEADGKAAET